MTYPPPWLSSWLSARSPHLRALVDGLRREAADLLAQADALDAELQRRQARWEPPVRREAAE